MRVSCPLCNTGIHKRYSPRPHLLPPHHTPTHLLSSPSLSFTCPHLTSFTFIPPSLPLPACLPAHVSDFWLLQAVGGSDPFIHIISIVQAAVVGQIPLPPGTAAAELCAAEDCPGLLLVLCRDGTLQLWQISSGVCLWSCKTDAFAAVSLPGMVVLVTMINVGFRWTACGL